MAKTNQEIAKEIFQGKWGNNLERKRRHGKSSMMNFALKLNTMPFAAVCWAEQSVMHWVPP